MVDSGCTDFSRVLKPKIGKMGTLNLKKVPMGTHVEAVPCQILTFTSSSDVPKLIPSLTHCCFPPNQPRPLATSKLWQFVFGAAFDARLYLSSSSRASWDSQVLCSTRSKWDCAGLFPTVWGKLHCRMPSWGKEMGCTPGRQSTVGKG